MSSFWKILTFLISLRKRSTKVDQSWFANNTIMTGEMKFF